MRVLPRLLALAGLTAATVVATGAPASANHQCMPDDQVCVISPQLTIPVGTPTISPTGVSPYSVQGPDLCDPGGCRKTFIDLPAAHVSATGGTIVTISVPEYGVRIDSTGQSSIHYGIPTVTPAGGTPVIGATLVAQVSYNPVRTVPASSSCDPMVPVTVGPVSVSSGHDCYLRVVVTL